MPEQEDAPLIISSVSEGLFFKSLKTSVHFELCKTISEPVAFKVLSKYPQIYKVTPNVGVIEGPIDRTKTISVSLNNKHVYSTDEVKRLANDVLLIDVIAVSDADQSSGGSPAAKKPNRSNVYNFDWSKVTDRSKVSLLRIRSRLDPLLRSKLLEEIEERLHAEAIEEQKVREEEAAARARAESEAKTEAVSKEKLEAEAKALAEPKPAEVNKTVEIEIQTDENTNPDSTVEMTMASECAVEPELPEIPAQAELSNLLEEIRKLDANRVIRVLTECQKPTKYPLFGIVNQADTAAQMRHWIRTGDFGQH